MNKQNPELRPASLDDARRHMYTSAIIPGLVMAVDIMAIVLSGVATYLAYVYFNAYVLEYYVFAISFVAAATLMLFNRAELYQISAIMRPVARSDSMLAAVITAFLFFLTIAFSLKASEIYSRIWLYGFAGASFVSVVLCRMLLYRIFRAMSRHGMIGRTMVVLGSGEQAVRFLEQLDRVKPYFTSVLGVYDPDYRRLGAEMAGQPVLGGIEELIAAARHAKIDDVVVALPWNADGQVVHAVERLKELPVNVYISSDLVGFQLAFRPALGHFQQLPLFEVVQRPISGWSSVIKTIEDYVLASLALVLLSPLLILVAIAIKLDSAGPVFFMQPRLGFNNRHFEIYKFRSMYHREIPERRVRQASRDDPRITRIGRFIRRTSIDELPQLLNVLNGTMSLVGPRPHALSHNEEFSEQVRGYFARHRVKPGITGWAQVNGFRGETETVEKIRARVEHDIYYAENWSLLFDIRILLTTVFVVLSRRRRTERVPSIQFPGIAGADPLGHPKTCGAHPAVAGRRSKIGAADRTAELLGQISEEPLAKRDHGEEQHDDGGHRHGPGDKAGRHCGEQQDQGESERIERRAPNEHRSQPLADGDDGIGNDKRRRLAGHARQRDRLEAAAPDRDQKGHGEGKGAHDVRYQEIAGVPPGYRYARAPGSHGAQTRADAEDCDQQGPRGELGAVDQAECRRPYQHVDDHQSDAARE